jgi:hypothetical protein
LSLAPGLANSHFTPAGGFAVRIDRLSIRRACGSRVISLSTASSAAEKGRSPREAGFENWRRERD